MVNLPETLHFIVNPQYLSYWVDNGIVLLSSTPKPIQYSPIGWDDYSIQVARSSEFFALDRSFTIPLKHVEDGARILKERIYRYGPEDKCIYIIMRRKVYDDGTQYGLYYSHLYKGEIDLSQLKHSGPTVTVNIMEGGLPKWIKANKNVKYEFKMNVPEAVLVKHDGVRLQQSIKFLLTSPLFETHSHGAEGNPTEVNGYLYGVQKLSEESNVVGFETSDVISEPEGSSVNYATDLRFFGKAPAAFSGVMNFNLSFRTGMEGFGTGNVKVELIKGPPSGGTLVYSFFNQAPPASISGVRFDITQPVTLNLAKDDQLFLRITLKSESGFAGGPNRVFFQAIESESTLEYYYTHPTTYVRYFTLYYLFQQLTLKVTEGNHEAASDLLSNLAAGGVPNVLVTCGDALRGFDQAILKTSLSDFYQSVNAVYCVGMGAVLQKLKLELKKYWVDYSNPIIVGNAAPTPTYSPANDYLYSRWKFGYQNKDIEGVNGRYSFNNTFVYTGPNTRQEKEYDGVCRYYADPYVIEDIRMNLDGKSTTDDTGDNEVYLTACLPIPALETIDGNDVLVYQIDRRLNVYASGHPEVGTIFNLPITPKQNLFRHGSFIRSCHYKQDNKFLVFQTTEKYRDLSVAEPGKRIVDEDANVEIGSFDAPMFIPWLTEIEVESPEDLMDTLEITPVKSVQYVDGSVTLGGLIVKAGIQASNEAQAYTLLLAPDIDMTKLIEIFE